MPTATPNPNWGTPPWQINFSPKSAPVPPSIDIAIIGAGFTGLAAAAWLRHIAAEKSVAVFEAKTIGAGASGRTGGMALAESAAGDIPGLGDVLAGFKRITTDLQIECNLALPGAWEIARTTGIKPSPIQWKDSGTLRVVNEVPGGTLDPGKLVAGLARSAAEHGAVILENHPVTNIGWADESAPKSKEVSKLKSEAKSETPASLVIEVSGKRCSAQKILFATNALSLELTGLARRVEPKLTLAIATKPLAESQLQAIGLAGGNPFYTVDLPYLWGRVRPDRSVIFGAGLVDADESGDLSRVNVGTGRPAEMFVAIERRIRNLHPALAETEFTHRWGGPILIAENWRPVFTHHPRSKNALVLAAYAGHGIALSVYLGAWAAEALISSRPLPQWGSIPS